MREGGGESEKERARKERELREIKTMSRIESETERGSKESQNHQRKRQLDLMDCEHTQT